MDIISLIASFGGLAWMIVAFIVALSVIVAIHEYGHYIVGRWSGIHADVFSIGFGPVIWSAFDKRGTKWQIAALPFGGYVKFAGDANAASGVDANAMAAAAEDPAALRRTMHGAPLWARTATVAAGPIFNFVLSILIFAGVALTSGVISDPLTVGEPRDLPMHAGQLRTGDVILEIDGKPVPSVEDDAYGLFFSDLPRRESLTYTVEREGERITLEGPHYQPPYVTALAARSAAIAAGLKAGDVIVSIDDTPISAFWQLKDTVESANGAPLRLGILRDGVQLEKTLTPKRVDEPQPDGGFKTEWRIGVYGGNAFEAAKESPGVINALGSGVAQMYRIIEGSISGLGHMITGAISTCNLSGPIGIAQTSGEMASQGLVSFIWFIAVLSTAVGFLNLFPIPALDGGHLVFYAFEAVTGRPPSERALQALMGAGISLVLTFMLFAVFNDIFCP